MATDTTIYLQNQLRAKQEVNRGGALTGTVAGIIMSVFAMTVNLLQLAGFFQPVQYVSTTFFGLSLTFRGGLFIALLGMMSHLLFSTLMGVLFAYLTVRLSSWGKLILSGLGFSFLLWLILAFLLLPILSPAIGPSFPQMLTFLVFGLALVLTPYFEAKIAHRNELKANRG
jgi:hypothetical protein